MALRRQQQSSSGSSNLSSIEEALLEQKRSYQRHLRSLQKSLRNELLQEQQKNSATQTTPSSLYAQRLMKRRKKCSGADPDLEIEKAPIRTSLSSLSLMLQQQQKQKQNNAPAPPEAATSDTSSPGIPYYPLCRFALQPTLFYSSLIPFYYPASYLPPNILCGLAPKNYEQSAQMPPKAAKKCSFTVEALLSSEN